MGAAVNILLVSDSHHWRLLRSCRFPEIGADTLAPLLSRRRCLVRVLPTHSGHKYGMSSWRKPLLKCIAHAMLQATGQVDTGGPSQHGENSKSCGMTEVPVSVEPVHALQQFTDPRRTSAWTSNGEGNGARPFKPGGERLISRTVTPRT